MGMNMWDNVYKSQCLIPAGILKKKKFSPFVLGGGWELEVAMPGFPESVIWSRQVLWSRHQVQKKSPGSR